MICPIFSLSFDRKHHIAITKDHSMIGRKDQHRQQLQLKNEEEWFERGLGEGLHKEI